MPSKSSCFYGKWLIIREVFSMMSAKSSCLCGKLLLKLVVLIVMQLKLVVFMIDGC